MTSVYQGNPTTFGKNVTFSERVQFKGPTIFSDIEFPDTTHHGTIYGTHLDISGESTFHDIVHIPDALEANDVTIAGTLVVDSGLSTNTNIEIPTVRLFDTNKNKGLFLDYASMKIWNPTKDADNFISSFSDNGDCTFHRNLHVEGGIQIKGGVQIEPTGTNDQFSVINTSALFSSTNSTDTVTFNTPTHISKLFSTEITNPIFSCNELDGFAFLGNTIKFKESQVEFNGTTAKTTITFGPNSEIKFNGTTTVGGRDIDLGGTVLEQMTQLKFAQDGVIQMNSGGSVDMQYKISEDSNLTSKISMSPNDNTENGYPKLLLSHTTGNKETIINHESIVTRFASIRPSIRQYTTFDMTMNRDEGGIIFDYNTKPEVTNPYAAIRVNNTGEATENFGGSSMIFQTYNDVDGTQHNSMILGEDGTINTKYSFLARSSMSELTTWTKMTYPQNDLNPSIQTTLSFTHDGTERNQTLNMHPSFVTMTDSLHEGSTYKACHNIVKLENTTSDMSNTQTSQSIVLQEGSIVDEQYKNLQMTPNIAVLTEKIDDGEFSRTSIYTNGRSITHSDSIISDINNIDSAVTGVIFTENVGEQGTQLKTKRVIGDVNDSRLPYERSIIMNDSSLTLSATNEGGSGCAIHITPDIINIDGQMDLTSLNPAFDTLQVPKEPTISEPVIFGATKEFVHTLHTEHDESSNGIILHGIREQSFVPTTSSTNEQGVETPTYVDFRSRIQHRTCTTTFPVAIQATTYMTPDINIHHNLLTHFRKIINNQTTINNEDMMRYNSSDTVLPRDNRVVQVKTAIEFYDTTHDLITDFADVPKRNILDILSLEYTIFITQGSSTPQFMFTQQLSCNGSFRLLVTGDSKTNFVIRDMRKQYGGQTFQAKTVSDIVITTISSDYSNATS